MRLIGLVGHANSGKNATGELLKEEVGAQLIAFAEPFKVFVMDVFAFPYNVMYGPSVLRNRPDRRYGSAGTGLFARFSAGWRWDSIQREWVKALDRFFTAGPRWAAAVLRRYERVYGEFNPWVRDDAGLRLTKWMEHMREQSIVTPRYALQTLGDWGTETRPDFWVKLLFDSISAPLYRHSVVVITDVRQVVEAQAIQRAGGEVWRVERPGSHHPSFFRAGIRNHRSEREIDTVGMQALITRTIYNDMPLPVMKERIRVAMREPRTRVQE